MERDEKGKWVQRASWPDGRFMAELVLGHRHGFASAPDAVFPSSSYQGMTAKDYREVYARALRELDNTRKAFGDVFRRFVANVEDDALYSRGSLANLAEEQGIIGTGEQAHMLYVILEHIGYRAEFTKDGVGKIKPHGVPIPAWLGMRWKAALWKVALEDKA